LKIENSGIFYSLFGNTIKNGAQYAVCVGWTESIKQRAFIENSSWLRLYMVA
jgi:hypothetical protein